MTLFGLVPAHADDSEVIDFGDSRLEACVRDALSLTADSDITQGEARTLASLTCRNQSVGTLTGLQHFTSLQSLELQNNSIESIEPLQGMDSLRWLALNTNEISDISPLADIDLEALFISGNNVTDLSAVASMDSLIRLNISTNGVRNLEPLRDKSSLRYLTSDHNDIADLGPVATLTDLESLWLQNSGLDDGDIQMLQNFTNLNHLRLSGNEISDLSPLAGLDSLNQLRINNNRIADVSGLPLPIDALYLHDQNVNLGPLPQDEPQPNPVVGLDGQPVALADAIYDGGSNEFTPTANGPLSITWADNSGDFSGTLDFTLESDLLDPLGLEVTAQPVYDLNYEWDVALDGQDVVVPHGEETVQVDYEMVATPSGPTSRGFRITGDVTVTNSNATAVDDVTVTVEGSSATCAAGEGITVPANGEAAIFYFCDLPDDTATDAQVTLTATVTWDEDALPGSGGTVAESATADFDDASPFTSGQYRGMSFEHHEGPVGAELDATAGAQSSTYSVQWDAPDAGQCEDVTTQAGLTEDNVVLERDDATVTICVEAPLQVTKNPTATFDRHYEWDIDKSVTTDGVVDERGEATFDYLVQVEPAGFTDSGWAIAGLIEVHNPNTFGQITFDVAEATDLGAQCTLEETTAITLAGGDTITLGYECFFDEAPDYTATSTATVTWTDPAGDEASASGSAQAHFEVDGEVDRVVQVWDDHTDPANPVLLGEADGLDSGTWTFEYSLVLPGVVGETVTFTNTAWIEAAGDNPHAATTVEIIIDAGAEPGTEPEVAAESGLPATGAAIAGAGLLALLLAAGGFALLALRRQAQI